MRGVIFICLLALPGCAAGGVPIALQVLSGAASAATIADRVLDIDISLAQARRDKIPLVPSHVILPTPRGPDRQIGDRL